MDYQLLTTKPLLRRICADYPELLYVLPLETLTASVLARVYWTDGTNDAYTLEADVPFTAGEVMYWDISPYTQDYAALQPLKTVDYVKVWVDVEDGGETVRGYVYTADTDQSRAVYYVNSAGGVDVVICAGDEQYTQENRAVDTVQPLVLDTTLQNLRSYDVTGQRARTGLLLHTHHAYATREEMAALRCFDLLRRGWLWEAISGGPRLLPVLLADNIPYATARATAVAVPIRLRFAYDEQSLDRIDL